MSDEGLLKSHHRHAVNGRTGNGHGNGNIQLMGNLPQFRCKHALLQSRYVPHDSVNLGPQILFLA